MRSAFLLLLLASLGLGLPAARAGAAVAEIPFSFVDGFIVVKAKVPQSVEPLNFLLDSGAGISVLSLQTARRLHLELGRPEQVRGVDMETSAFHLAGVSAAGADGTPFSQIPLAVDLANASQLCSQPVDGLLGVDFFRSRAVQIDYSARRIRLLPSSAAIANTLPIKPFNGTLCIPISVNGSKTRWARLDTGCNDALHWVVPRTPERKTSPQVSIGFLTDSTNLALADLQLGTEKLNKIETSLHAAPLFPGEAGLVGNGVLSRYVVTIDVPHLRVSFAP